MKRWHFYFFGIGFIIMTLTVGVVLAVEWNSGRKSVEDRLDEFGQEARSRMKPYFENAGIAYPPEKITLIGLKAEKTLEVYAAGKDERFIFICAYPILAASGTAGPKLREGDRQVPEGIYKIELLNPNSRYHVSLRVNYPNADDKAQAKQEGRTNLGGDIMIHGRMASIGCLAMGDPVAEELFVLAADAGISNISVLLAPCDLRKENASDSRAWVSGLYKRIKSEMEPYVKEKSIKEVTEK